MQKAITILAACAALMSCGAKGSAAADTATTDTDGAAKVQAAAFDADSAFMFLKTQTDLGPRIHGSQAHSQCAAWLESKLKEYGAQVTLQTADLKAADGMMLKAVNIFGQYNPQASERVLLMAHWDTRPWADNDPDEANHSKPLLGANDGASGVAVILEIARQLAKEAPGKGVDILFVDAEDRGSKDDEDSWALGAQYFVVNQVIPGYTPSEVILLDMVGGRDAKFAREYFSQRYAPELVNKLWDTARAIGHSAYFVNSQGGAINDDHVHFIEAGLPAVDIIEYNPSSGTGFNPTWHTLSDTPENIDPATLKAVGETVHTYLRQ